MKAKRIYVNAAEHRAVLAIREHGAPDARPAQRLDGLLVACVPNGQIGPVTGVAAWEDRADCDLFCAGWNGDLRFLEVLQ